MQNQYYFSSNFDKEIKQKLNIRSGENHFQIPPFSNSHSAAAKAYYYSAAAEAY
jgi:hypothetical protein